MQLVSYTFNPVIQTAGARIGINWKLMYWCELNEEVTHRQKCPCRPDLACRVPLGSPRDKHCLRRHSLFPDSLWASWVVAQLNYSPIQAIPGQKVIYKNVHVFLKMPISLCIPLCLCLRTPVVLKYRKATRVFLKNIIHLFSARFSLVPVAKHLYK